MRFLDVLIVGVGGCPGDENAGPGGLPAKVLEIISQTEPAGREATSQHLCQGAVWRETGWVQCGGRVTIYTEEY